MNFKNIICYEYCDILYGKNDIELYGYDKNKTIGEMIDLAALNQCPIIIKNGLEGKWYLKGKGKTVEYLKNKIEEQKGKSRYGVRCYLIEY